MKLRYYLRGLGIGIFVTALILSITSEPAKPLTDAEIRAKALTLGMVDGESRTLSNSGSEPASAQNQAQPSKTPEGSESPAPSESPSSSESPAPSESPVSSESPVPSESPVSSESPVPSESPVSSENPVPSASPSKAPQKGTVTIRIVRGDGSYTVSRRLEEAGLVDSAREFDAYLAEQGYDKSVRTGTYEIPADATWKEIADMIAG